VKQGLTDNLPIPDGSASVVICNSVLIVVPREKIPASLREIHRIARPGARIFLGEIPVAQTQAPNPKFTSVSQTLAYLYRTQGLRASLGMLRRMIYWKLTGQPAIIRDGSAVFFSARPEEFIAMAKDVGLEIVRHWQHDYPDGRINYLFRKWDA